MKRFILEIGIACGILLVLYLALFIPSLTAYRDRAGTVHDKNSELEANLGVVARSRQVEKEFRNVSTELDRLKRRINEKPDKAKMATTLRKIADELDLVVTMDGSWAISTNNSAEDNPFWSGLFRRFTKSMTLEGDFFAIGRFLETVEEADAFARNTNVVMKKRSKGNSGLQVELTVDLYDMHELKFK